MKRGERLASSLAVLSLVLSVAFGQTKPQPQLESVSVSGVAHVLTVDGDLKPAVYARVLLFEDPDPEKHVTVELMLTGLQNIVREVGKLRSKIGILSQDCLHTLGTKEALLQKLASLKEKNIGGVQAQETDEEGRFRFKAVNPFKDYAIVVQGRAGSYDGFWMKNIPNLKGDITLNLTAMSPTCDLKHPADH